MATVVDAASFGENFASVANFSEGMPADNHRDHWHANDAEREDCEESSDQNVVDLLVSQVEVRKRRLLFRLLNSTDVNGAAAVNAPMPSTPSTPLLPPPLPLPPPPLPPPPPPHACTQCADVILLNKVDLVSAEQLEFATSVLTRLNPRATLFKTVQATAPLDKIVNTGLYSFTETTASGE